MGHITLLFKSGVDDVKSSMIEVGVVRIQDYIEGKAVEVASTHDVPIKVVRNVNSRAKKVIHILMPEAGIVLESLREVKSDCKQWFGRVD
jgi:hypothetical protein